MIDYKKIDALYKRYGYVAKVKDGIRIYEYKQGRYFGVDFVNYQETPESRKIHEEYKDQGYAWAFKNYESIEQVEEELFKSFFRVDHFKTNLNRRYEQFVKQQTVSLGSAKYEYIKCPYSFMSYDSDNLPKFETIHNGNSIVQHVTDIIATTDKPLFVIIEAAAGFGKTCSSYELLKTINLLDGDQIPLYVELSRNREARIFKHILLSEIENQFQNIVNSEIVIHEIKQGRIPLIIDGFDELLSTDLSVKDSQLRDVESMLATIIELLEDKAKIIITSRKTAIFNGEEFYEWMQHQSQTYTVARYTLSEPEISDWLDNEYIMAMASVEFPIEEVANPVLLTYIRNLPIEEFMNLIKQANSIIDKYFDFLLTRERERQDFEFSNEMQLRILKKLVRIMSEFDIKSEDKSFIKEIIRDSNESVFDQYIKDTKALPKPTKDELADTLSNHALLDRKQNNEVGVINEFILGYLVAKNLVDGDYERHYPKRAFANFITQDLASSAVLSFKVQTKENKKRLHEVLAQSNFSYPVEFNLNRDIALLGEVLGIYNCGLVTDAVIRDITFSIKSEFIDFIFTDCIFKRCSFRKSSFINSGFSGCTFHNCRWENESQETAQKTNISSLYLVGCDATNDFIEQYYKEEETPEKNTIKSVGDIEDIIVRYFMRVDGKRSSSMRRIANIKSDLSEYDDKLVDKALNNLKKKSYVLINGGNVFIQKEGVAYYRNNLQM